MLLPSSLAPVPTRWIVPYLRLARGTARCHGDRLWAMAAHCSKIHVGEARDGSSFAEPNRDKRCCFPHRTSSKGLSTSIPPQKTNPFIIELSCSLVFCWLRLLHSGLPDNPHSAGALPSAGVFPVGKHKMRLSRLGEVDDVRQPRLAGHSDSNLRRMRTLPRQLS